MSDTAEATKEEVVEEKPYGAAHLEALVTAHPLPTWRLVAWPFMLLIALGLAWTFFAELEEVTVAEGVVAPQGDLKVIQHLEGGVIQSIFVREGSRVTVDQPLVQLDLRASSVNPEELQIRQDGQLVLKARFEAEAAGKEPIFPTDVRRRQPQLVATQRRSYDARRRELRSTINVLDNQVRQKELEVRELVAKRQSNQRNLRLAKERLKDSAELLAKKLVPRNEHLKLEAEVEDLESEIKTLGTAIPRTQSTVTEAKERRSETVDRFRREAQEQLGAVEEAIAQINEELQRASEKGARLEIKSPINGIVKNMRYNTIGGVVKAGEAIMEIVPTGDRLIIDAKLNPVDRGFVVEGQAARVKISTYDFVRYGALEGKVSLVAPDATEDDDDGPYFQVLVETDKTYLGEQEGQLPITPGMQATVDIKTGTKTVIDFLIKPVLKMKSEAFRER